MKAELVLGNLKREREALNNKLERLEQALAKDWQDIDQEYLCTQQYNAMSLYAHILDERIVDIECKLEEKKNEIADAKSHETCHCCDEKIFNNNKNLDSCDQRNDNELSETMIIMIKDIFGEDLF